MAVFSSSDFFLNFSVIEWVEHIPLCHKIKKNHKVWFNNWLIIGLLKMSPILLAQIYTYNKLNDQFQWCINLCESNLLCSMASSAEWLGLITASAWLSCFTATIRKKTQTITCCCEKTGQDDQKSTKKYRKDRLQWIGRCCKTGVKSPQSRGLCITMDWEAAMKEKR